MTIRALTFALLVSATPVLMPHLASAQPASNKADAVTESARQRFQEGVRLYDRGKYEEARAAFLQAWALKQHPAVLLNLAQSELRANHPVEAARHFSQYLRDYLAASADDRKTAQAGLDAARKKTARVDVHVNVPGADVLIDDELVGRSPLAEPIDVPAGARKIEVRLAGYDTAVKQVSARLGTVEAVEMALTKPGAAAVGPLPGTTSDSLQPSDSALSDEPKAAKEKTSSAALSTEGRTPFPQWAMHDEVAWVTGGVMVAGLALGVGFTISRNQAAENVDHLTGQIRDRAASDQDLARYSSNGQVWDRRKNPCADPIPRTTVDYAPACGQLKSNMDDEDRYRTLSYVGWGLAGAGAVGTVAMYFLRTSPSTGAEKAPSAPTTAIAPMLAPGLQGLWLGGTF